MTTTLAVDSDWLTPEDIAALSRATSDCGRLQRALLRQIRAHEADGMLPTSGRFLFYELEGLGFVSKEQPARTDGKRGRRPDQNMHSALTHLREVGLVPWDAIEDESRRHDAWQTAPTVADYVLESVDYARADPWGGQPAPLILCESRSLAGVLRNVAMRYCCPIASTNGHSKGFLITKVAPTLRPGQRVLYLGDWDHCGREIEDCNRRTLIEHANPWWSVLERNASRPITSVLRAAGEDPEIWERVALTPEQVEEHQLDTISKPDKRFNPVRYYDAVETEGLGQGLIVALLTARLDALMPEPITDVLEREQRQRVRVEAALRNIDFGSDE